MPATDEDDRVYQLDIMIADAEQLVTEQALRYEMAVFNGQGTNEAMRLLRVFEDILFGYITARAAITGTQPRMPDI